MKKYDFEAIKKEMRKIAEEKGIASGTIIESHIDEDLVKFWDNKELEAARLFIKYKKHLSHYGTYAIYSNRENAVWLMVHEKDRTHMCFSLNGRGTWGMYTFEGDNGKHFINSETIFAEDMVELGWFNKIEDIIEL